MKSCWTSQTGWCPYKKAMWQRQAFADLENEEDHAEGEGRRPSTMKGKTGVTELQVKEHQGRLVTSSNQKRQGRSPSPEPSERVQPWWHLDFGPLGFITVKRIIFLLLVTCYSSTRKVPTVSSMIWALEIGVNKTWKIPALMKLTF